MRKFAIFFVLLFASGVWAQEKPRQDPPATPAASLDLLKRDLAQLQDSRKQQEMNLNATDGAIQYIQALIARLEKEKAAEPKPEAKPAAKPVDPPPAKATEKVPK
jgi:hypothetical protein